MKKFLLMAIAVGTFTFTSCSSDDDSGSLGTCVDLQAEMIAAAQAYGEDQSNENCTAYKTALGAYIEADCDTNGDFQTQYNNLNCE